MHDQLGRPPESLYRIRSSIQIVDTRMGSCRLTTQPHLNTRCQYRLQHLTHLHIPEQATDRPTHTILYHSKNLEQNHLVARRVASFKLAVRDRRAQLYKCRVDVGAFRVYDPAEKEVVEGGKGGGGNGSRR